MYLIRAYGVNESRVCVWYWNYWSVCWWSMLCWQQMATAFSTARCSIPRNGQNSPWRNSENTPVSNTLSGAIKGALCPWGIQSGEGVFSPVFPYPSSPLQLLTHHLAGELLVMAVWGWVGTQRCTQLNSTRLIDKTALGAVSALNRVLRNWSPREQH